MSCHYTDCVVSIDGVEGTAIDHVFRRDLPSTAMGLFGCDFIDGGDLSGKDFQELDERWWDGDFASHRVTIPIS
jgi:hypothetical protein